jgi:hypothetical protein
MLPVFQPQMAIGERAYPRSMPGRSGASGADSEDSPMPSCNDTKVAGAFSAPTAPRSELEPATREKRAVALTGLVVTVARVGVVMFDVRFVVGGKV